MRHTSSADIEANRTFELLGKCEGHRQSDVPETNDRDAFVHDVIDGARSGPASRTELVLASEKRASAADEGTGLPQSVAVDIERLGAELDLFVEEAHRARLAGALTGLGVGAALVPSGPMLLQRTDGVSKRSSSA